MGDFYLTIDKDFLVHSHGYFISPSSRDAFCDKGLVMELINFFRERGGSVLDLGCGDDRYVKELRAEGITAEGYDGNPFIEQITDGVCKIWDLTEVRKLDTEFDWVLCLEVGEHIPEEFENRLIQNIDLNNKKGVILSWAIEGQGGIAHLNCRNNDYIRKIFDNLDYENDIVTEKRLRDSATNCYWFANSLMVFVRRNYQ